MAAVRVWSCYWLPRHPVRNGLLPHVWQQALCLPRAPLTTCPGRAEKPQLPAAPGTPLTALGWGDTRPGTFSPSETLQQVRAGLGSCIWAVLSICSAVVPWDCARAFALLGCIRHSAPGIAGCGPARQACRTLPRHSDSLPCCACPAVPALQLDLALRPLRVCQAVFPKSPGYRQPENTLICAGGCVGRLLSAVRALPAPASRLVCS